MKKAKKRLYMKTKLLATAVLLSSLMVAVSLIAIIEITNTVDSASRIHSEVITTLDDLYTATSLIEKTRTEGRDALLRQTRLEREQSVARITGYVKHARELASAYDDSRISNESRALLSEMKELLDEYAVRLNMFSSMMTQEQLDEAVIYMEDSLSPVSKACLDGLLNLADIQLRAGEEITGTSIENSRFTLILVCVVAIAGLVITFALGIYFSISISKPILLAASQIKKAADGDCTIRLPSGEGAEIGQLFDAFNSMNTDADTLLGYMKRTISELRESAQNLLEISSLMASNSEELSGQTASASASAEEFSTGVTQSSASLSTASANIGAMATAIDEINTTVASVAASAEETSTRVQQSSMLVDNIQNSIKSASDTVVIVSNSFNSLAESVEEIDKSFATGSHQVRETARQMNRIDEMSKSTNMIIRDLESASKQIGKIIGVINDIADQTNMLALNAAIEAASAGDVGRGFMVVANEVKELARQTADATDEIANQIENMQMKVPEAVGAVSEITTIIGEMNNTMNNITESIASQSTRTNKIAENSASAAHRMNEITLEINRISQNAVSVTKAVVESSKGCDEIARATADVAIGSQEIAMNAERTSSNLFEIDRASKEMAMGLAGITRNIFLFNEETTIIQNSADSTKLLSKDLLKTAEEMEEYVSKFTISG